MRAASARPSTPLIRAIQECPGDPNRWRALLIDISTTLHAAFAGFVGWDTATDSRIDLSYGADASTLRQYHEHYAAVNPWVIDGTRRFVDGLALPTQAFVDDARFLRSEFYNDYARHHGGRHGLAAQLHSVGGSFHLSLTRTAHGAFGQDELQTVQWLIPHLQNAIAAEQQLTLWRVGWAALRDALETLPDAVFVLDRPVALNAGARRLLATHAPLFRLDDGTVRIAVAAADAALQRRVQQAALTHAVRPPFRLTVPEVATFSVRVVADPGPAGAAPVGVVIIATRLRGRTLATVLGSHYGFTRREAEVAAAALHAGSAAAIGASLGMSVATARVHLARVYRKTGTHTRQQLRSIVDGLARR